MMSISKCSKCLKTPDDILMLVCSHDLCLPCASKSFASQLSKKNKRSFICDICSSNTDLDSNSVYELEKIYLTTTTLQDKSNRKPIPKNNNLSSEKQLKPRSQSKQTENKENQKSFTTDKTIVLDKQLRASLHQSQRHLSKQQSENSFLQTRGPCSDHPDEEVSYFCFDCNNKCICPECIIHGIHKNHEVKTIKKAYPIIKKQLEELVETNNQCLSQIEHQRQDLEKKQSQQLALQEHMRLQVIQEIQGLHQLLNNKQTELLEKIENIPSILQQQEPYLIRLNEVEDKLQGYNERICDALDLRDECGLLNYYGSIQGQTQPQIPPQPTIQEPEISNNVLTQLNEVKRLISQIDNQ